MTPRRRLAIAAAALAATMGGLVGAAAWPHASDERASEAGATPGSFLGGAVRFALPGGWLVQQWPFGAGGEGVALFIPCPPLDDTPHSANANLLAEPNVEREDLAGWSARRLRGQVPKRVVSDRVERGWRTVVSTGVDRGARYVVVERFGVSAGARLHAVAAFPALAGVDPGWYAQAGADVDRFLGSLRVDGLAPPSVRVAWDGRTLALRDADAGRRAPPWWWLASVSEAPVGATAWR